MGTKASQVMKIEYPNGPKYWNQSLVGETHIISVVRCSYGSTHLIIRATFTDSFISFPIYAVVIFSFF